MEPSRENNFSYMRSVAMTLVIVLQRPVAGSLHQTCLGDGEEAPAISGKVRVSISDKLKHAWPLARLLSTGATMPTEPAVQGR